MIERIINAHLTVILFKNFNLKLSGYRSNPYDLAVIAFSGRSYEEA